MLRSAASGGGAIGMASDSLVNKGVIVRPGREPTAGQARTFIISGIGRGGTTMVAALLREAGVYIGERVSDLVHEDYEFLDALRSRDPAHLDALIAQRNGRGGDWAFKAPTLIGYLQPQDLVRFRNPHLLFVFRDPVAIAVRHGAAEHTDPMAALRDIANASAGMAEFVDNADCPALLMSYEKAILFPDALVDAVTRFCGLEGGADLRERLLQRIKPNAEEYITTARRSFGGSLDFVWNGTLHGWCWEVGSDEPIDVEISLNGETVATVRADQYREDLQQAGIGSGRHGFSVNLAALGATGDEVVTARPSGRTYELPHGGRPFRQFPGFTASAGAG